RSPVRVCVVDDPLLKAVRETNVGLEKIDVEGRRALELLIELTVRRDRNAAGIVRANAVEGITGEEHTRTRAPFRVERFPQLVPGVRIHRWNPQRRDAVREPDPAELLAVA